MNEKSDLLKWFVRHIHMGTCFSGMRPPLNRLKKSETVIQKKPMANAIKAGLSTRNKNQTHCTLQLSSSHTPLETTTRLHFPEPTCASPRSSPSSLSPRLRSRKRHSRASTTAPPQARTRSARTSGARVSSFSSPFVAGRKLTHNRCRLRLPDHDAAEHEREQRLVAHGVGLAERLEQREELRQRREQHRQGRPGAPAGCMCAMSDAR